MKHLKSTPFMTGFGIGVIAAVAANLYSLLKLQEHSGCFDCGLPAGFPFALYRTETFIGGEGFIWFGIVANSIVAIVFGMILGFFVHHIWIFIGSRIGGTRLD